MNNNAVWIAVAIVVALIVIGLIVFAARRARNQKRAQEADRIRAEVHQDKQRVDRQANLVAESEAKARAAQAEAEAKAAEAARLADSAATRRDALTSSREHLDARREHADKLDPRITPDGKHDDRVADNRVAEDKPQFSATDGDGRHEAGRVHPDISGR